MSAVADAADVRVASRRRRRCAGAPGADRAAGGRARFDKRKLVAFIFMVFGMFMAILDIQIVSASLSQIQAGLSASQDEVTWVQTSYLVAEVIMIPLSGLPVADVFDAHHLHDFGRRLHAMSLMCSTATSIDEMIVWRALQGFIGGGMIPTVFASAYTIFPRSKQPIVAPDHRSGRDARADHRPDGRRLSDRSVLLALAVPRQHPARGSW